MPARTYAQTCSVARALDVLGERWTLLIVRELLLGPKRFKDLLTALPAMGTNRLGERLKTLEGAGVVARRTLPPPAGSRVYELTLSGERLRPAIYCLGAWGRQLPLPAGGLSDTPRAELIALGLAGTSSPELSADLAETYEFHVGEETFHVNADHGVLTTRSGPAPVEPDLLVECDLQVFFALAAAELSPPEATRLGRARIVGDPAMFARVFELLSYDRSTRPLRLVPG
jgi:DNA-binding HxlR family transcriptional regulator